MFERRPMVGGACVTEELWPGVRLPTGAYVLSLLRPEIIRDLDLEGHGLRVALKEPSLYVKFSQGRDLFIWNDIRKTVKEISKYSKRDAEAYVRWARFWNEFSQIAGPLMLTPPPSVDEADDLLSFIKGMEVDEQRALEFLQVFFQDARTMLDSYFESEEVKAALVEDSVVGTNAPPSASGTAYVLAHHAIGSVNGVQGAWGYPVGGMGSVTQALRRCAEEAGAEVYTGHEVTRITVRHGAACGVELGDGHTVEARAVVSNADPKTTFLRLLPGDALEEAFKAKVRSLRSTGVSYKLVGYTNELPDYGYGVRAGPEHVASQLIIPSVEYVEEAYADSVVHGYSRHPWLSINTPGAVDVTLAPQGKHVFSVFGQYLPYSSRLDELKPEIIDVTLNKIREYAPNFKPAECETITPLDIERRFGITGGNIFHLDMQPSQLYVFRPMPEANRYSTPVPGLYLCGSGTHPGGGVTGAPGYNCAMRVLEHLRRGSS